MMKKLRFTAVQSAASMLVGFALPLAASAYAQSVPEDLPNAAQEACRTSAVAKGFQVANVVSVEV